jgi:hypothetical protein
MSVSALFQQNADNCRQRAAEAITSDVKLEWLRLADEWQTVVDAIGVIKALPQDPSFSAEVFADA